MRRRLLFAAAALLLAVDGGSFTYTTWRIVAEHHRLCVIERGDRLDDLALARKAGIRLPVTSVPGC